MSWLSDLGGTLGSMGSVLGAFVPGVGQAIAGVGGLLAMTDDPDALILFPEYPFEPGGMAYGISRTRPGGDERGIYLGGSSWTNGPSYKAEDHSSWEDEKWRFFIAPSNAGVPQPMGIGLGGGSAIYEINGVMGAQGGLSNSNQVFRLSWSHWGGGNGNPTGYNSYGPVDDTRQWREEITLVYGALWGLDLETMTRNPIGQGPRRLMVKDDNTSRMHIISVPDFVQIERGPLREIVLAERGKDAAEFWRDEWLSATEPVLDSSVADIRGWDEHGGGAVQTWMQSAPLWNQDDSGNNTAYRNYPSLSSWTNLETPEAETAFTQWAAYQAVELAKYQTAGAEWWGQKQQIEAQAAWDEYQAQAEAYYWEQWQANQAQSQAYLADLTQYSNPFTSPPQANPQAEQTSLTGDVDTSSSLGAPPIPDASPNLPTDPYVEPEPVPAAAPLTVGEEEAIGIGAAAAALLIL